jgi:Xaa-Pro aminopeptidase
MTDDDIVFADFGPIFSGWEGDFGRTWVLGDDPTKIRLRDDLALVFAAGKAFYEGRPGIAAAGLYAEVVRLASERAPGRPGTRDRRLLRGAAYLGT